MTLLLLFTAFAFLVFFMGRGRQQAMEEYEARRDDAKAERLMAEVRKDLAAQDQESPKSSRD